MRFRWLPWRFVIKHVAQAHGFLDPIALMAKLQQFVQPSEINEPVELLRAGAVMHARGLINNRVIQHNLDWIWPYWVERQFNPRDTSFIPRAFSITHINLTHRNWTAVGLPDYAQLPIVDPCGLLMPFLNEWSLDTWLLTDEGGALLPCKASRCNQRLECADELSVVTESEADGLKITGRASVMPENRTPVCRLDINAVADREAWLVVALRPYNPEGVGFVYNVELDSTRRRWMIENHRAVEFDSGVDRHCVSNYRGGDVYLRLLNREDQLAGECDIGMLTAAALFKLDGGSRKLSIRIPLENNAGGVNVEAGSWRRHLQVACRLQIPDGKFQALYDSALRTLLLHSSEDIYPGPYTYKRFWFRDAAFIIHALLCTGFYDRAEKALDRFQSRQKPSGYFHSQEGEWDSNGEALWIINRFCRLTGRAPKTEWLRMIRRAADWIIKKRRPDNTGDAIAGLMPAGFSAEHLGPNDHYYWDNFWSIAGLKAAADTLASVGEDESSRRYRRVQVDYSASVEHSLNLAADIIGSAAIPASPNRRLDSGAIGSLVYGYPTCLCAANDERLLNTVEFLLDKCCLHGGFFQDMTHSGINAYLTLHIAQVLLRAGDLRYFKLMQAVADMASPTGQWPEAIHPHTGGGCMGDGQHVWAAAEWVLMIRNCFLYEEDDCLVIGAGVPARWLETKEAIHFGPAPTSFGILQISIEPHHDDQYIVHWDPVWHRRAPRMEVRMPECKHVVLEPAQCGQHGHITIERAA